MNIGVIGIGNLGQPIALRLVEKGFDVTACDRDAARLAPLSAAGARVTQTVADCAPCDVVLVIVTTSEQVSDAAQALVSARSRHDEHLRPCVFAVLSTVPANSVVALAERIRPAGLYIVDAPNSGGAERARAGELTFMTGGTPEDLGALEPVLSALATHVISCGSVGAGQRIKLLNNILCHASSVLMGETLRLAFEQGLDPDALVSTMEVSSGRNWLTGTPGFAARVLAQQSRDRATFDGILAILQKDMQIARDEVAADDIAAYPMIAALAQAISRLGDETFQTWSEVGRKAGRTD